MTRKREQTWVELAEPFAKKLSLPGKFGGEIRLTPDAAASLAKAIRTLGRAADAEQDYRKSLSRLLLFMFGLLAMLLVLAR